MQHVTLSRLEIVGDIRMSTPRVVIEEIAHVSGIEYIESDFRNWASIRKLVDKIRAKDYPSIRYPLQIDDTRAIAAFVNPDCAWHWDAVISAGTFLIGNYYGVNCRYPDRFTVGPQTPMVIDSLNACVLYKICQQHGIKTNRDNTIQDMGIIVSMIEKDITVNRSILSDMVFSLNEEQVLDSYLRIAAERRKVRVVSGEEVTVEVGAITAEDPISMMNNPTLHQETHEELDEEPLPLASFDWNRLNESVNYFSDINSVLPRIRPNTREEAIALAIFNEGIDISRAKDPIAEYKILTVMGSDYIPADPTLRDMYKRDPYSISLTHTFNPLIPSGLYNSNTLTSLALSEGYSSSEFSYNDVYEILQVAYLSPTFYRGVLPTVTNSETFSLESVDDFHPSEIVSYGIKDQPCYAFSIGELAEMLEQCCSYYNPISKDMFTPISIKKLDMICQQIDPAEPRSAVTAKSNMRKAIAKIDLFTDGAKTKAKDLYIAYNKSDNNSKIVIETCIHLLLEMAMYMRGWMGKTDPYPIDLAPVDPNDVGTVDINVTNAINRFETFLELSQMTSLIGDLPLMTWRGEFEASNTPSQGYTIMDRVNIVKTGEIGSNTASCIRLSSNWLSYSAHYYMGIIGLGSPFTLSTLAHIS